MLSLRALALCIALAGAAGLRAFIPLFYLAVAVHLHLFPARALNHQFTQYVDIAHSDPVFYVLGLLALAEILVEKIVLWTELIDLPLLMLRVLAAVVVAFAVVPIRDLGTAVTAAIMTGAIGAVPIVNLHARQHLHDAIRLPGYVSFASSLLLDAVSLLVAALALQDPYVAAALLHPLCWLAAVMLNRWRNTHFERIVSNNMPQAPELPPDWQGAGKTGSGQLRVP
jgi:hypothetical protein